MDERFFRICRSVAPAAVYLAKTTVFVADRPGSLAALVEGFAPHGVNTVSLHYNRSEHPQGGLP